ncbi:MAG: sensor histidine kinase [Terriglobia bacterium]
MFESARLKLTAWYMLIIVVVSTFFSLSIYDGVVSDLNDGFARVERRIRQIPAFASPATPIPFLERDLQRAKNRLLLKLISTNGLIVALAAVSAYFLAGKTLRPIEDNLQEQKRFVTDASHELRTPLTALKATTEVALRSKDLSVEEAKAALASNLEEVNSLNTLSDDLLSLAKFERVDHGLTFEPLSLSGLIERTAKTITPLVKKKGNHLEVSTDDASVCGNEASLEKMLVSLLDNANKYTPEGGRISLEARPEGKCARIEVRDTGVGIPETYLPHLFDRFFRVDQSRSKRRVPGFGLGLSIVRRIVQLHKGSINVQSTVGEGTTFTIKLPLAGN